MIRLLKAGNGMNILGQGPLVMLFALPAFVVASAFHLQLPHLARLPLPHAVSVVLGTLLVVPGVVMWLVAVVQLLVQFPRGRLVTTGSYGVCRNPIYSSFGVLILPGISFLTGTWVYIIAGAALCLATTLFIGREESDLVRVFGAEYRRYTARVHRIIPFAGGTGVRGESPPAHAGKSGQAGAEARSAKALLAWGAVAGVFYIASDFVAASTWEEYRYADQAVSELMAIGAPTRPLLVGLFSAWNAMMLALAVGVLRSAGGKRGLRVAGWLLVGYALLGECALLFFPMHVRGMEPTLTDTMHIWGTAVYVLLLLVAMGFAAAALRGRFLAYTVLTIVLLAVFGYLGGRDAVDVRANMPTPWLGIKERVNIYLTMAWFTVFSVVLIRRKR